MTRNNLLCLVLLLLASVSLLGQNPSEKYHRTRIRLEGHSMQELASLGLEVDHGEYVVGRHLTNDFSESELRQLTEAGFEYEILISDMKDYYTNRERRIAENGSVRGGNPCPDQTASSGVFPYPVPSNFHLGSMAGFFTYDEMLDILDSMRLLYPDLISSRQIVSPSIITHGGRPIYWLRLSDNPDTDETTEPEVLYTALHHAREPNGLSQMIYYLWYLLENYDTDPEIKYLVDNTELYFMPCLNPDGYLYNEETDPNGFGFWRKNRRDNEDGTFGVDLNRNYGYEWGFDNSGSSPNPGSETYRGPAGFSEPETQAVEAFCNEHEFTTALNYHTYGNLLIYPWGFSDSPSPDAATFNNLSNIMTLQNDYVAGTGTETVGYVVNGGSDDWMYGETETKPAIFSMTPEVGVASSGFWPSIAEIIPNCQASMWMNLVTANSPHVAGIVTADPAQQEIGSDHLFFHYEVQRYGFTDGPLTVSVRSLQESMITVAEEPKVYHLAANENASDSTALSIVGNISAGMELFFELAINNGSFSRVDTVKRVYGSYIDSPVFTDNFDDTNAWSNDGGWSETTEDFVSAPSSLTDSPFGPYPNESFTTITLDEPITAGEAEEYLLQFWAKWNIEAFYDWAQLEFKVNEGDWIAACGLYTVLGSDQQDFGQPIWEGVQNEWVQEAIHLTPFLNAGDALQLRFKLVSDVFVNPDGFYVDDLAFIERNSDPVSTTTLLAPKDFSWTITPNPAHQQTQFQFRSPLAENASGQWQLFNTSGQLIQQESLELRAGYARVDVSTQALPAGVYWITAQLDGQALKAQRLVIVK
jgi:hypothetical protein